MMKERMSLAHKKQHQPLYVRSVSSKEKSAISRSIVEKIHKETPPGRFLKKNGNAVWLEIQEKTVIAKTSQALRADSQKMRQQSLSSNVIQNSEISGTLAHQPVHLETTCGLSSDHDSSSSVEKIHGKEEIVTKLSENDVLFGRGMRTNRHKGNI